MTTVSRAPEREIKLALDLGSDLPDLREVVSACVRQPEELLRSVYFDTPDLRLWNRGVTLRHRRNQEADTGTWTLKLPLPPSGDALVRTELKWDGSDDQIPTDALAVVLGIVRRQHLEKVAELSSERLRFLLEDHGVAWAELTNDVVTVVGGPGDGLRFRQVEIEFIEEASGRDDEARSVVQALRRAGAKPDPHPKLEKVLGPPKGDRKLDRRSSAEEVVTQAITSALARLLDHECRIRAAGPHADAEDVHQARVATRRLRSDLATVGPLLDPVWVDHVRADLRSVGEVFGAVRDTDVLIKRLGEAGAGVRLIQALDVQRAAAVASLHRVLGGPRYIDLLDRLHAASVQPPIMDRHSAGRKACRAFPRLVNRSWKKLRREARLARRHPSDEQLHRVRKRAKQLRYASELSTPVIGRPARKTAEASESLQTVLGEHHDAAVAATWLVEAGHSGVVETVPDLANLIVREEMRKQQLARKWRSSYKRVAKARNRTWLRDVT